MTFSKDSDSGSHTDPIRRGIKYGTTCQAIKGIFFEYFKETSIHGFKYIGENKRSTLDRILWLLAVITSIIFCSYFISNTWEKRISSPVIVTFNEKQTPVWDIPFPSVTICPETKTHTNIFNYTETYWNIADYKNITQDGQYYWEAISQICRPRLESRSFGKLSANASDLIKAMLIAAPAFDETLDDCYWKTQNFNCTEFFDSILTEEGICFTFNSLKSEHYRTELYNSRKRDFIGYKFDNDRQLEWDLENGYTEQAGEETFPARALGAGDLESLTVFLTDRKEDEEQMCRNAVQGFKVILHTPGEEPQVTQKFINIPFDQTVLLTIKPNIMATSDGLRHYHPNERQCYYQDERYLRYFTVYTQANCELECLANQTLAKCGCVKFSMPRNLSHPVCGAGSMKCLDDVINRSKTINFKLKNNPTQLDDLSSSCKCLPTCFGIEYKAEIEHQVAINVVQTARAFREESDDNSIFRTRVTEININFRGDVYNSLKRSELYTTTDFIASCGGLLGLFMGVSILSLVELVYFVTLRLWTNLKTRRRKQRREFKKKRNARKIINSSSITS